MRTLWIRAITALAALAVPAGAHATTYALHVGGVCSTKFGSSVGSWSGVVEKDIYVDQRKSMSTAVSNMKGKLDSYCRGSNWCYVYVYSNGGAVIGKTLATYGSRWNIVWVAVAGGNEGGSELSGMGDVPFLDSISNAIRKMIVGCSLANKIAPSDHRPAWNHNATGGNTFYMFVGDAKSWHALTVLSPFLPGKDDGLAPFHSAGARTSKGSSSNVCTHSRWSRHVIASPCKGFSKDHSGIKRKHIIETGG